ncbi:MAG: hypothetical protein GX931_02225 [Acholeplasmataceae bacterium]|jgi:hypothetical protein|nr:hypothetical protein [Acholeplasmataceae bacterium]
MTTQIMIFSGWTLYGQINDANKWMAENKQYKIIDVKIKTKFLGVIVYIIYEC